MCFKAKHFGLILLTGWNAFQDEALVDLKNENIIFGFYDSI